jgi:PIN domain-containing protein
MRLRDPGTIDAAITTVQDLRRYLNNAWSRANDRMGTMSRPAYPFVHWCEAYARPRLKNLFESSEGLLEELDASYIRIKANEEQPGVDAMVSREFASWDRRLDEVIDELDKQKRLMLRPGYPVVLDTSALMEGAPFATFDWHGLDPSLAAVPVRLVVPILVIEELDDLLHDRNADRRRKARAATRSLLDIHKTRPTEPAGLPGQSRITIEVLLDGDRHQRHPNNDAEIIEQALMLRDLTGKNVLLAACDLRMVYRAGAAHLPAVLVPRADGQVPI